MNIKWYDNVSGRGYTPHIEVKTMLNLGRTMFQKYIRPHIRFHLRRCYWVFPFTCRRSSCFLAHTHTRTAFTLPLTPQCAHKPAILPSQEGLKRKSTEEQLIFVAAHCSWQPVRHMTHSRHKGWGLVMQSGRRVLGNKRRVAKVRKSKIRLK